MKCENAPEMTHRQSFGQYQFGRWESNRMSKTDLEELGEDTSELADGFSKYAEEIQQLTGFNIMVEGTTNEFKDLYDIMEGIAKVWDQLSDTQQARVSEILGGKYMCRAA